MIAKRIEPNKLIEYKMMNKLDLIAKKLNKIDLIAQQFCGDFYSCEEIIPKNQKIFPFYFFHNYNRYKIISSNKVENYEPFICDYCHEQFETNTAGYYCAYIVFESKNDIRICCNIHHCRKGSKIYDYHEQKYGFRNPIALGKYEKSIPHLLVFHEFFSFSYSYKVRKYLDGITWKIIDKEFGSNRGGGSFLDGHREWNLKELTYSKKIGDKPLIKLTKPKIVKIANEILVENRPVVQLTLF